MANLSCRYSDTHYTQDDLHSKTFSYGLITSLLYSPWVQFARKKEFEGIDQRCWQMLGNNMQRPLGGTAISQAAFDALAGHSAYSGLDNGFSAAGASYVKCPNSWHEWHQHWWCGHQSGIKWDSPQDNFLPRPDRVFELLEEELKKHGVEIRARADVYSVFMCEVLHKKSSEDKTAYIREIGGKICRTNFYEFQKDLSALNQKLKKSLRAIYGIINKEGKKQYISLDFEKGAFEYHDDKGRHLGEYTFTGKPIGTKGALASHDIKICEK